MYEVREFVNDGGLMSMASLVAMIPARTLLAR